MSTDYKIEYTDKNTCHWKVLIQDTLTKLPYGIAFIESQHLPGSSFYVVLQIATIPIDAISIIARASAMNLGSQVTGEMLPNGFVQLFLGNDTWQYFVTIKRNGYADEVIYLNPPQSQRPVVSLKAATGSPVVIKRINNEDDKFACIRSMEAIIRFYNEDNSVSLSTFGGDDSSDSRWKVTIYKTLSNVSPSPENYNPVFIGFLALDDLTEDLQDPVNEVKLTVTDGLGLLKEVPLKSASGAPISGVRTLIDYILIALSGTGLLLNLRLIDRTMVETGLGELFGSAFVTSNHALQISGKHDHKADIGEIIRVYLSGNVYDMEVTAVSYDQSLTTFSFSTPYLITGLYLNVKLDFPIKELLALETVGVDAGTFDNGKNELKSCYEVLKGILQNRYFIAQENGEWILANIGEIGLDNVIHRTFNSDAFFIDESIKSNVSTVGRNEGLKFINRSGNVRLMRPYKSVRANFNLINKTSDLKNIDYSEGDFISNEIGRPYGYQFLLFEDTTNHKITDYTLKKYDPKGWTFSKIDDATGSLTTADITAYTRRYFLDGRETDRELVISSPTANGNNYILENTGGIPVEKNDKVLFSCKWRAPNFLRTTASIYPYVAQVILLGDSGTTYTLFSNNSDNRNSWYTEPIATKYTQYLSGYQTPPKTTGGGLLSRPKNNFEEARWGVSDWCNIKNDWFSGGDGGGNPSEPFPEGGLIKIRLCHFTSMFQSRGNNNEGAQGLFQDIKLEVVKYQLNSDIQVNGQFNKVSQSGDYKAVKEFDVTIDNSAKRSYPGTLLIQDSESYAGYQYNLAGNFTNNVVLPDIRGSWGKLVAYNVWRQLFKVQRNISGSLDITGNSMPGITSNYILEPGSNHSHVYNKKFCLISFEWDTAKGILYSVTFGELLTGEADREIFESGFVQDINT